MLVNACLWALGMESAIKPELNVALVGPFKPNTFGNQTHAPGIKPEMYAGWDSPIPAHNNINKPAKKPGRQNSKNAEPAKQPGAAKAAESAPAVAASGSGKAARFVRIELPGDKRVLTLAEVEVFSGGKNIASGGKATQSSTLGDAVAGRAIDGNKDSDFNKKGQTHTENKGTTNPWWELDLGTGDGHREGSDLESQGLREPARWLHADAARCGPEGSLPRDGRGRGRSDRDQCRERGQA